MNNDRARPNDFRWRPSAFSSASTTGLRAPAASVAEIDARGIAEEDEGGDGAQDMHGWTQDAREE